jgi:hypothetical protein
MCSWLHDSKAIACHPSAILKTFVPKKKSKGIVYYSDRIEELNKCPSLASDFSSSPAAVAAAIQQRGDETVMRGGGDIICRNDSTAATAAVTICPKNCSTIHGARKNDRGVADAIEESDHYHLRSRKRKQP